MLSKSNLKRTKLDIRKILKKYVSENGIGMLYMIVDELKVEEYKRRTQEQIRRFGKANNIKCLNCGHILKFIDKTWNINKKEYSPVYYECTKCLKKFNITQLTAKPKG